MPLTRKERQELIAQVERDADDPDAWGEAVEAEPHNRRFGAQISLRLPPDVADALWAEAQRRGIGGTVLARELIEQGLRTQQQRVLVELTLNDKGEVQSARVT